MTTYYAFFGHTLNENLIEQFLRGLKNENSQNKLISQVENWNFEKAVALQNTEIEVSELKYKNVNVNKVVCIKNVQQKISKQSSKTNDQQSRELCKFWGKQV